MRIVIDTNVVYQALRNQSGASNYILQLIRANQLDLMLSIPVFLEYADVLLRPQTLQDLERTDEEIEAILQFIAYIGKPIPIHFLMRPNLKDENDNMFVDLAFASQASYIITQNMKDFTKQTELKFDLLQIVTPATFVRHWRLHNER